MLHSLCPVDVITLIIYSGLSHEDSFIIRTSAGGGETALWFPPNPSNGNAPQTSSGAGGTFISIVLVPLITTTGYHSIGITILKNAYLHHAYNILIHTADYVAYCSFCWENKKTIKNNSEPFKTFVQYYCKRHIVRVCYF